jgi:hypothetical protein
MAALAERPAQLLHRDVRRLRQEREDQLRLRLDPSRAAIAPERPRPKIALLPLQSPPAAHACRAHPETLSHRPMARSFRNGCEHARAEID